MPELRYGSPSEAGMLPERIDRVRDLAAGWIKEGYTPALSVLVARRGVIVLHEGFGVLGPQEGAPPLPRDAVFPVMSVTKSLTGTLLMCLVEDGLIGVNRPAAEYLPEFTGKWKDQVLVHHLLTHTWGEDIEGIIEVMARRVAEGAALPGQQAPGIEQVLQACYEAPLARPPGELMRYGAFGYMLLGEIVRRVSGRPFEDFAQERILGPLGMTDSWLVVPEHVSPRVVRRPAEAPLAGRSIIGAGLNSRETELAPTAAGGLYSTALDLAVYAQTFLDGGRYGDTRILSRPSVEAMTRNQIPGVPFEFGLDSTARGPASMGYGWFVNSHVKWRPMGSLQSLGSINHMGLGASIVWADPAREIVGVYLEVLLNMTEDLESLWNFDLFQNAVTAAVED